MTSANYLMAKCHPRDYDFNVASSSQLFTHERMRVYREGAVKPKVAGSDKMVSRLPEEVTYMIEDNVIEEGHRRAEAKVLAYKRRLERASHLEKLEMMDEMRSQISEPFDLITWPAISRPIEEYTNSTFRLTISPGVTPKYPVWDLQENHLSPAHVLVCLPWYHSQFHYGENGCDYDGNYLNFSKNHASIVDNCHSANMLWELPLRKMSILSLKRAIKEMDLEVAEDSEGNAKGCGPFPSHIVGKPKWIPDDDVWKWHKKVQAIDRGIQEEIDSLPEGHPRREGRKVEEINVTVDPAVESFATRDGETYRRRVDRRSKGWPSKNDDTHGKLWIPQLLMKHQCKVSNKCDDRDPNNAEQPCLSHQAPEAPRPSPDDSGADADQDTQMESGSDWTSDEDGENSEHDSGSDGYEEVDLVPEVPDFMDIGQQGGSSTVSRQAQTLPKTFGRSTVGIFMNRMLDTLCMRSEKETAEETHTDEDVSSGNVSSYRGTRPMPWTVGGVASMNRAHGTSVPGP
ncbi:hypothetical protein B0J14DRAFT_634004 [Halenospora varia]|nr:hypothetical protein B0J14DRAFT_634004 [Halenospora varia]